MAGLIVKSLTLNDIRVMCSNIRMLLGISADEYVDIVKVLEHQITSWGVEFEVVPIKEMGHIHGESILEHNIIRIREDVYNRACEGCGRDRLTMAHELGHIILHRKEEITLARGEGTIPPYLDPEWQANAFAGELLAPFQYIKHMDILDISVAYGVSIEAASVQKKRRK
ncbi:ImmA/IrrE family metallo-endopeptidase [Veillonella sp. CHU594]|uniref:ImmA/IrrE family metallo-endopeptidase n=1 Tax=Veillonella sp. CHU594 TaxID=2490948 RepID=UPI000F8F2658|nr:ImmA/IrrE family metallo-endopeptidase [Veillonella sp. CHU594]